MSESTYDFNPARDHIINVARLQEDLVAFPTILYFYTCKKADAEREYEASKFNYDEARAAVYLMTKNSGEKVTEKHLESILDIDTTVMSAKSNMLNSKHSFETIKGYVDALRAKKDMLVQLSADMRTERK